MKEVSLFNKNGAVYFVSFFIYTLSYAKLVDNYSLWNYIKYGPIIILLFLGFIHKKNKLIYSLADLGMMSMFFFSVTLSCVTQNLELVDFVVALSYIIVFALYRLVGRNIYITYRSMFYCALGIFFAIFFALALSKNEIISQLLYGIEGRRRVFGKFSHANIFASIVFAGNIFCTTSFIFEKNKALRRLMAFFIIIGFIFIFLSNSRTTMVIMFIYFCYIGYKKICNSINRKSEMLFITFVILVGALTAYLFVFEYVLAQKTFWTRMDDYQRISLHGIEWLFGHMFSSSASGGSFEFAPYTIVYRMGVIGCICYIALFYQLFKNRKNISGKQRSLYEASLLSFLVSTIGEAYIINITQVLSFSMYTTIYFLGGNNIKE